MSEPVGVPVLVVANSEDQSEAINALLRNAGQAVHCTWAVSADALPDAIAVTDPLILFVYLDAETELEQAIAAADDHEAEITVLAVGLEIDEASIGAALEAGANDLISLQHPKRFQRVVQRELAAVSAQRSLRGAVTSAVKQRHELQEIVQGSPDAIAYSHDGIFVATNPAWSELFGYDERDALVGTLALDLFDCDDHAAIKGAMSACREGKWEGHQLRAAGMSSSGAPVKLSLELAQAEFDDEPCIRMSVRPEPVAPTLVHSVVPETNLGETGVNTGVFLSAQYMDLLEAKISEPVSGGIKALVYLKPDEFSRIQDEIGELAANDIQRRLGEILTDLTQPHDFLSRYGANAFTALLPRGTRRDVTAWADSFLTKVADQIFEVGGRSLAITCSAGIAELDAHHKDAQTLVSAAEEANREARENGGNRTVIHIEKTNTIEVKLDDRIWSERIKSALMQDRFRLAHMPIASLQGFGQNKYDVLVRMIDEQGDEILPGKFIPAAERNDMMKTIDRWVIRATLDYCQENPDKSYFVRLSRDSVSDPSIVDWIRDQVAGTNMQPDQLIVQVTERNAELHLKETRDMASVLHAAGCRFAIEHFGVGHTPLQVLEHVPMDFVKIDGSYMQGIAENARTQDRVREYISKAKSKAIQTIAERVEDANTMAVLWQVGIEFIQGYYVQEPEVVLEATG